MTPLLLFLACTTTPQDDESPWGIATSHSASWAVESWAPAVAETGITWMRGFYQAEPDRVLSALEKSGYRTTGILQWSKKGGPFSFPADALPEWKAYVADILRKTRGRVRHWEVWNEPPNFSESKSPADYAKIVAAAYEAVKEMDPSAQVGLAAQSVNLNFLAQAIEAGAANRFDYVTVHPYETLGLVERGWEAQYMSIVPTIRKMLADKCPGRKDAPVWFTELGQPVEKDVTPARQADTLVKAYVLALAQGVRRVHWFEGIDGDSGPFGLIAGTSGSSPRRPSFAAMAHLIKALGKTPRFKGWLLLNGQHYAFAFEGPSGPVLATWTAPGTSARVAFGARVRALRPGSGDVSEGELVDLSPSPILILDAPPAYVAEARANAGRPFPWGGDFSGAESVRWEGSGGGHGLHPLETGRTVRVDGRQAWDMSGSSGLRFTVDPNFLSYDKVPLRITAVLRRRGQEPAGFNLKYESASGWKGAGGWYAVPEGAAWTTRSWILRDPQFVGKWGFHFAFDSDSPRHSGYVLLSVTVTKE